MTQYMMTRLIVVCLLGSCLFLSGCASQSLQELRHVEPKESGFLTYLSDYYLKLAEEEYDYGRHHISQRMADKGLKAAYGDAVEPEILDDTQDYHGYDKDIMQARSLLDKYLDDHARQAEPELAARVMTLYDCFLQRARVDAPEDDILYCQQQYYKNFALLRTNLQQASTVQEPRKALPPVLPDVSSNETQNRETSATTPALATSYLIYFEWNKAALNAQALANLKQMAQEILSIKQPFELVLNGHTDTSGSEDYNMALSQKRAASIRDMLVSFGVSKAIMTLFAFGESDPVVPTGDGVKEPKNRRVEIFIE